MRFAVWVSDRGSHQWVDADDSDDAARKYAQKAFAAGELSHDGALLMVAWQVPSGDVYVVRYRVELQYGFWGAKQELPV